MLILNKYPYGPDSRLISPEINLPEINADEEILLRFREYWTYSSSDRGKVQIQSYDAINNVWSDWSVLKTINQHSPVWHHGRVDLSNYAGQQVRIAFYHIDGTETSYGSNVHRESWGWYIDDVEIVTQIVPVISETTDFESGWGAWYSDNGIWEVGEATTGPETCYSGTSCAGTILADKYPYGPDSRLISPEIDLPEINANEQIILRFRQYRIYSSSDKGVLQISTYSSENDTWGDWEDKNTITSNITEWQHSSINLSEYAGKTVRIAFYHIDGTETSYGSNVHAESWGWYIDDVELTHFISQQVTIGEELNGTFSGNGDLKYFLINVPPGGHLRITLDDLNDIGVNELYIRHGSMPTAGDYDYRYSNLGGADQDIFIPSATPGPWYIMVYADSVDENGDFTLSTDFSTGILLENISPQRSGNAVPALITINGAGFEPSTPVALVQGETVIPANEVDFVSKTSLLADFNLTNVFSGDYQLRVGTGDQSEEMPFEVLEGGLAKLETNLIVPSRVGYNNAATIWVEYANTGEVAMPAPLLVVSATQKGREGAILEYAQALSLQGFWTSALPEGFSNTVQFLASGTTPGILQPGESIRKPIQFAGWQKPWDLTYSPITFNLGAVEASTVDAVDWDRLKVEMKPTELSPEVWNILWSNFVSQVDGTWGDYVTMLTDNAIYLHKLGYEVTDVADLLAFEFAQANGLNVIQNLASASDAFVTAPGMDISFNRVFPQSISSRFELGSFGRGWSHNWDMSLSIETDGTVVVKEPGGSRRIFQPDSRHSGKYFSSPGDHGTLTALGGSTFSLQEKNGLLRKFQSDGKLDYLEDSNGNRITAGYTDNLLSSLTHSAGQSLSITYNEQNRIETIIDPDGRQTSFSYDPEGQHLISAEYFDSSIVSYQYNTNTGSYKQHAITEIGFPGATHQYFSYDARGRLASISRDGGSEAIGLSYDDVGMVAIADAFSNTAKYYLDHRGNLAKVVNPLGNITRMKYNDAFNLTTTVDPAGHSNFYEYDDKGNLIHTTDALGNGTRFSYSGPFDRMTKLVDAKGNVTDYAFDIKGNLNSITYDDSSIESWTYDNKGTPVSWANRRGNSLSFEYDVSGRITAKVYPDNSRVDYSYDSRGNLTSATDVIGTTFLQYNANDRLEKITYPGNRFLQYTYNVAGQRSSSINQLGHRLDYHYDSAGRLETITDETSTEIVHYYYDTAGRLERKVLGNGVYTTYKYDEAWQLIELINYKPDDSVLSKFIYSYDERGRRTSMTTLEGRWDYQYDDLGQLTAWTAPDGRHVDYQYDALGNRIAVTDEGAVTNYTTNNLNQYSTVGDTTFQFDADGNLAQKITAIGTTTYTYNDENRLVAVSSPEGNWVYSYDAFGNRVRIGDNGTLTDFVVDPVGFGNVVGEYDNSSGKLLANVDHGFGLLSRSDDFGTSNFYSFDAIGSTREITNNQGNLENTYRYLPFGAVNSANESIDNSFKFIGEFGVHDKNKELIYMRARFFNPFLGRFVSNDPIGLSGGDVNLNRYVFNNPNNYIDPEGKLWGLVVGGGAAAGRWCFFNLATCARVGLIAVGAVCEFFTDGCGAPGGALKKSDFIGPAIDCLTDPNCRPGGGNQGQQPPNEKKPPNQRQSEPGMCYEYPPMCYKEPPIPNVPGQPVITQPIRPWDPNEKTGSNGYGTQRLVSSDSRLSYRVDFENDNTATAPAQIVTITDQLDTDLDWVTFELTGIGFGDTWIAVPENTQHYETATSMSYNGVDFNVEIDAGIHVATGEVYTNFYTIQPFTGLPPSVDTGFLPPEDGTGRGQGYFTYTVKPKSGLAAGTEIRNIALITFDYQESIATNQVDPHDPSQGTDPNKEALNTIAPATADLTTSSTIGGAVTNPGEGTSTYGWGKTVNLNAVQNEGYSFINWSGEVDTVSDVHNPNTTITVYDNFSIKANFASNLSASLNKGFNLISAPTNSGVISDAYSLLEKLDFSAAKVEKVLRFNWASGIVQEAYYNPDGSLGGDNFAIVAGEGLIVYAAEKLDYQITQGNCPVYDLASGINWVGTPCEPNQTSAYSLLQAIGDDTVVSGIQRFNPITGRFETASYENNQPTGVDFLINASEGYFIFMKQENYGIIP